MFSKINYLRAGENPGGLAKLQFVLTNVMRNFGETPPHEINILDLGCGRGDFSIPLGELGYTVYGIDMFEPRIREAQAACCLSNVTFEAKDAMDITTGKHFDVVLCVEVIEHLTDPATFLSCVKSLLTPSGLLIITVPNGYSLLEVVKRSKEAVKNTALGQALLKLKRLLFPIPEELLACQHHGDIHEQYFSPSSLRRFINGTGFKISQWQNAGPLYALLNPLHIISTKSRIFHEFDRIDSAMGLHSPGWSSGGWYLVCALTDK